VKTVSDKVVGHLLLILLQVYLWTRKYPQNCGSHRP